MQEIVLLLQGRKVLDIDYPVGPFGTKVSIAILGYTVLLVTYDGHYLVVKINDCYINLSYYYIPHKEA